MTRLGLFVVLFVFTAALLAGCGGGGSSGAQASSQTTTVASGGSGGSTATTPSPTTGATTGPIVTASPTPATTPVPEPPFNGTASFTAQIKDEAGNPVKGADLEAQALTSTGKPAAGARKQSVQTDGDGVGRLSNLNSDQIYQLTVAHLDKKTLRTKFRVSDVSTINNQDLNLLLIAPPGVGVVEFAMPKSYTLTAVSGRPTPPATAAHGRLVNLTWAKSENAGFNAFLVYRSTDANQGLGPKAEQLSPTIDVPTRDTFTDSTVDPTSPVDSKKTIPMYYRVYEKILLPELGTFCYVGTNEVKVEFPIVEIAPNSATAPPYYEAPTTTPITITFDRKMDSGQDVKSWLSVVSHGPEADKQNGADPIITYTPTWNAPDYTVLTAKPTNPLDLSREITVSVKGARDAAGDTVPDSSATFTVTSGYDTTTGLQGQGTANYSSIASDGNGNVLYSEHFTGQTAVYQFPNHTITDGRNGQVIVGETQIGCIDLENRVWMAGTTNADGVVLNPWNDAVPASTLTQFARYPHLDVPVQAVYSRMVTMPVGRTLLLADLTNDTSVQQTIQVEDATDFAANVEICMGKPVGDTLAPYEYDDILSVDSPKQMVIKRIVGASPDWIGSRPKYSPFFAKFRWSTSWPPGTGRYPFETPASSVNTKLVAKTVALAPDARYGGLLYTYAPDNSVSNYPIGAMHVLEGVKDTNSVETAFIDAVNTIVGYVYWNVNKPWGSYADVVPPGMASTVTTTNYTYSEPAATAVDVVDGSDKTKVYHYVSDNGHHRILVFDDTSLDIKGLTEGKGYKGQWGSQSTDTLKGFGTFSSANGVSQVTQVFVDPDHFVYVVDKGNGVIQKFAGIGATKGGVSLPLGTFITQIKIQGTPINRLPACVAKATKASVTQGSLYYITDASPSDPSLGKTIKTCKPQASP